MKNCLHVPALLILFLISCKPAENQGRAKESGPEAAFKANPQPVRHQNVKTLEPGAAAPDFRLPGIDGKYYSLADFRDAKALVVIFTCNHCPTAQAYEARIKSVTADYRDKGVAVVVISPNSPLGLLYEELGYTDLNDDYEAMKLRAEYRKFNFPYLYDGDTEAASLQYGPAATPHAFLFSGDDKYALIEAVDKNWNGALPTRCWWSRAAKSSGSIREMQTCRS